MTNLSGRPVVQKGAKPVKSRASGRNREHLNRVGAMPCVICTEWGMQQLSRTQVHHCIHGRHSSKRRPDVMTIPLCEGHHQGLIDTSKIALHREPNAWRDEYGDDVDWISWVEARL